MDPSLTFERYRDIVDDWPAFLDALHRPLPTCIWTNRLRARPADLVESMARDSLSLQPLPWYEGAFLLPDTVQPGNRIEFITGLYHVQEEVSLIPPALMSLRGGLRVLDLCAAPGNKTAQIAVAMGNSGTVVANDINHHRHRAVKRTIDRLGLANVVMTTYNGTNLPVDVGLFDRVLADVPCSCEGTTRKHPSSLTHLGAEFSSRLVSRQAALLEKAFQVCKPGGCVVYSTCTFSPEENEGVVQALLDEVGPSRVELKPITIEGLRFSPGLTAWGARAFSSTMTRALRIWPHQNDTGGFFVAVLHKKA